MTNPGDHIQYLKGVGPKRAHLLEKLGISRIIDIFFHFPRTHQDRCEMTPISRLQANNEEEQTVEASILNIEEKMLNKKLHILTLVVSDGTGYLKIPFFNQRFLKRYFKVENRYIFTGKVQYKYGLQMTQVSHEKISTEMDQNFLNTGRIVPIYSLTDGLSQMQMRRMIKNALETHLSKVPDLLPSDLLDKHSLIQRRDALNHIHFPSTFTDLNKARETLIYEEFFLLQMSIIQRREKEKQTHKSTLSFSSNTQGIMHKFEEKLPFTLTLAQKKVLKEIFKDMTKKNSMLRLLQGDVGSGKTIVAIGAILLAIENGYQVAFMAPTEILATQHFQTLADFFDLFNIKADILVGSTKKSERSKILKKLESFETNVIVGTHALIQDDISFKKLGLVIIDEQHKFGVIQRSKLKHTFSPHVLVMTATPIPRTLAMTVYGDLDVSIIDQLPSGRKSIKTFHIKEKKRQDLYRFIREEVAKGRQAYLVYPLIENSEKIDLKSVENDFEHLCEDIFPDLNCAMVHGKIKSIEKEEQMQLFKEGKVDILVTTTVIEVGVNVPNATIMVIEESSRFGLSQLHQLRGRVGRGSNQSYCFLMGKTKTPESTQRIGVMCETNNGFKIAEEDLKIRGPGELFGWKQSGLPELRLGSLVEDFEKMTVAREDALALFSDPRHCATIQNIWETLHAKYEDKIDMATIA
ncbi:ATP-dependent DNA helicase RecG [PVC group bacterium (ex Bugula neritina AB1)]|nr:ATP-dependent DNA helicase RecG [PVC group bacterium (ex Bugula neritina AB1)]